ncbi:MAG TPA: alkaline phosphatase [Tepidisphaeraceae bacterium]|nr:alkaline phosphatase [Tepidisphaeraceae bacterium]
MSKRTTTVRNRTTLDRRGFLGLAAAATTTGLMLGTVPTGFARSPRSGTHARAKNVIFLVSGGASTGTITLADILTRRQKNRLSHWVNLFNRPGTRRSLQATHAANSTVTDSAAAASAWGCGLKVDNGGLNFLRDGKTPEPILTTARHAGLSTGLVTTTRLTHATPAGFVCNIRSRQMEDAIARQMMSRHVDVLLGGGEKFCTPTLQAQYDDLVVARTTDELAPALVGDKRVLGVFSRDHLNYSIERIPSEPTLGQMTRAALDRLSRNPDGFLLQVEAGRVDHAAHNNDAAALVSDQLEFDDAIAVAFDFAIRRDDTLLIVTTDHGNANPGLTLYADDGEAGLDRLTAATHSAEWIRGIGHRVARSGGDDQAALLPALVSEAYGIDLKPIERELFARLFRKERVMPFRNLDTLYGVLGAVMANYYGVNFISGNHTADHVETTLWGPGADLLGPVCDNTDLYKLMIRVLDLQVA